MSCEKKRYRWRRRAGGGPLLIEENLIINSKSTSSSTSTTTTTRRIQEEKHTASNARHRWYDEDKNDDDDDDDDEISFTPNETISEKIDRVLKKINAWTNETSTTAATNNNNSDIYQEQISSKKIDRPLSSYGNVRQRSYEYHPSYHPMENSIRRRCSSSTYGDPSLIKPQTVTTHRPYSMTFIDQPSTNNRQTFIRRSNEKMSNYSQPPPPPPPSASNRYVYQRQSMYSPRTNLSSLSSMYGSDFFYPSVAEQEQHEYDNLTWMPKTSRPPEVDQPFPTTVILHCQRCSRSVDRTSSRDISCQVPSDADNDDELYEDVTIEARKTSRSSPLFVSPRSSPVRCSPPPIADSLLAPYHFRRKHSLSSYISMHNRSKSVPSSSSSISSRQTTRLLPVLSPLPTSSQTNIVPSTNTLLRSIKTSIDAMKKRLKDIRRLSEVREQTNFHLLMKQNSLDTIKEWKILVVIFFLFSLATCMHVILEFLMFTDA